jgi:hypothetical protein
LTVNSLKIAHFEGATDIVFRVSAGTVLNLDAVLNLKLFNKMLPFQ